MKMQPIKYIIQNDRDILWGLTICSVGYQHILPGEEYPPQSAHPDEYIFNPQKGRVINEYQLLYLVEGEGSLVTATAGKIPLKGGDVFLLFPGEWHTYAPEKSVGWKELWIGFQGWNIDSRIDSGFFSKEHPYFSVGYNETIINLFTQALHIAEKQDKHFQQLLAGIVNYLLGLVITIDSNGKEKNNSNQQLIDKARIYMQNHVETRLDMPEVAEYLHISYSSFRHIFKQFTGLSPLQYYMNIKIQRAKDLLRSTSIPIKEISYILNFETSEYFTKLFKKKTGLTPSQFREQ